MKNDYITVRIAGESGEGIVSLGEILSRLFQQKGKTVMTFRTYPAEIKGGACQFQLRLANRSLFTPGEDPDVLVCFDEKSYFKYAMKKNKGILLYNSDDTSPEDNNYNAVIGIPFKQLTGPSRFDFPLKNMVALGVLGCLFKLEEKQLTDFVSSWFAKKDRETVLRNIEAVKAGFVYCKSYYDTVFSTLETKPEKDTVFLSGNQMLALGAIHAGCRFFTGYPITPASNILQYMLKELPKFGGKALQTEDEISAVGAAIGASYAGVKAMTATSGPGFSLMQEMLGLAAMAEIPLVVVDAQRAGPSTGMPTKMEQGDLLTAVYGSHGEGPRVVFAPATVQDSFTLIVSAFNISEALRVPVVVLTDLILAQRTESVDVSLFKNEKVINRAQYTLSDGDFSPFPFEYKNRQYIPLPGRETDIYTATGLEHDENGYPSYEPDVHLKMATKRHKKLDLAFEYEKGYDNYNAGVKNKIGIISWGSTHGPVMEALQHFENSIPYMSIKMLNPLPVTAIQQFCDKVDIMVVPEHNYSGQLALLLKSIVKNRIVRINKLQGLPFYKNELIEKLNLLLEQKIGPIEKIQF